MEIVYNVLTIVQHVWANLCACPALMVVFLIKMILLQPMDSALVLAPSLTILPSLTPASTKLSMTHSSVP